MTAAPAAERGSRSPWTVLAVLCLGLFMILLDGTIVNIAIPKIMIAFSTTLSNVEWVMNAYVLSFAVTLITLGRFGDLYGRKRLFWTGMALFTASSVACGLAPGIYWLIGFRALQGLGGAAMMPATLSIVAAVFPAGRRGAAMGIWGGVSGLATAIGPTLGGLIVDAASWRWIFLVNLPIGVASLVLASVYVPESKNPEAVETLDLPGVALVTAGLFCLTFALVEGQKLGWTSATIVALFATSAIGLVLFYFRERRVRQPLIDFSLFRSRNFLFGNITGFALSFGMMGVFFMVPIFLQTVLGFSAIKAGLAMSPMSVAIIFAAPLAGRLSDRFGSAWLVAGGMFLTALGIAWMAGLTPLQQGLRPDTALSDLVAPFVVAGVGIGCAIAPLTSAVMATAPRDRIGNASGVLSTMRQVGSVMGIAVLGAVLQNRLEHNVAAGVDAGLPAAPAAAREQITAALIRMGTHSRPSIAAMKDLSARMAEQMAAGMAGMPAALREAALKAVGEFMAQSPTLFKVWFTDAINTTFVVGVAVCVLGGVTALFLRSHVGDAGEASADESEVGTETAAATDAVNDDPAPASPKRTSASSSA